MAKTLDKTRPHATVHGDDESGARFEQDGVMYDGAWQGGRRHGGSSGEGRRSAAQYRRREYSEVLPAA